MTSKNKIVFSVLGGVFVVGAGVLGWLLWDKISFADQVAGELADEESKYEGFRNSKVFPCKASLDSIETNRQNYVEWYDNSMKAVSKADTNPSTETPAAFKQRLSSAVGKMKNLPGGLDGRIASQTFLFGFDQYLGENPTMPSDKDVPRLAAELDTIVHIVNLLSEAGIVEVKALSRQNASAPAEAVQQSGRRRQQKKAEEDKGPKTTELKYGIEFTTRPAGLVEALNMLTADEKFITIVDFAMRETVDTITDKFSASDSAKNTQSAGSRRRRGRGARQDAAVSGFAAAMEKKEAEPNTAAQRLVVDPESNAPIHVTMTLTVTDFGRPVQSPASVTGSEPASGDAPAAAAPKKEDK